MPKLRPAVTERRPLIRKSESLVDKFGAIAQLGERLRGTQEVGGSIPPGSTNIKDCLLPPRPVDKRLDKIRILFL
jgi:hypothetical protein